MMLSIIIIQSVHFILNLINLFRYSSLSMSLLNLLFLRRCHNRNDELYITLTLLKLMELELMFMIAWIKQNVFSSSILHLREQIKFDLERLPDFHWFFFTLKNFLNFYFYGNYKFYFVKVFWIILSPQNFL